VAEREHARLAILNQSYSSKRFTTSCHLVPPVETVEKIVQTAVQMLCKVIHAVASAGAGGFVQVGL
jgi:hypothetical protein